MKAWEGFADRLQVLSHLMMYCLVNHAILCVDWRDENWGQGKWDFSDFFEIIGMPVIPLEMVNRIKDAKIVPSCWTKEFIEKPINLLCLREEFICPIMRDSFEKVEGDILVTNGRGFRKFAGENIIGNLRFKPNVVTLIKQRLSNFYLPATVIHLRGTDRYSPDLMNTWLKQFDTLMPHSKARVYHVSDSKDLIEEWLKKVSYSEPCIQNSSILKIPHSTKQGTHQLSTEALAFYNVTKYDLIIDALADFLALAYATEAIGFEKSVYYEMARHISKYGPELIGSLVHGFQPQRKSLPKPT
jgi:hypothetical protein